MTEKETTILKNFAEWNGGFAPHECMEDEIRSYVESNVGDVTTDTEALNVLTFLMNQHNNAG